MPKSSYMGTRFDRLARLSERRVTEARVSLARANRTLDEFVDSIERRAASIANLKTTTASSVAEVQSRLALVSRLEHEVSLLQRAANEHVEKKLHPADHAYRDACQEQNALKALQERISLRLRKEIARKEQADLDDFAIQAWNRKRGPKHKEG